ncbi:MAG: dihydropteroate synthase [Thermovirgaceae bacterium]|nr:dihydropteroate synthase [Thermovirgaceae bacterium]
MTIYRFSLQNETDLWDAISKTGADERSFPFFNRKREVISFLLPEIDFRAANALKQELLSRGGDAIVHKNAIEGSVPRSNVVIMGTLKALRGLSEKLCAMPYWGLDRVREELEVALAALAIRRWELPIPGRERLSLGERTKIMGIINANNDSFYSGSRAGDAGSCAALASKMHEEGADIIDIGSESTRPGSSPLSSEEEADRLIPAIRAVRCELPGAIISADTFRAETAAAAIDAGADIINDISAGLFDDGMFPLLARTGNPVVIMHARDVPDGMHRSSVYGDIIGEIVSFFTRRIEAAENAGIDLGQIILDPGIGFSKDTGQNLRVLERIESFFTLGRPLIVGHSRKSTIGRVLGLNDPAQRLEGTLAVSAFCAFKGVPVIRVHDVARNFHAVRMIEALKGENL